MQKFFFISLLFLITSVILSYQIIELSQTYQTQKEQYAADLNYRNRFLDPNEWLDQAQTKAKMELADQRLTAINTLQNQVQYWSLGAIGLFFLYGLFFFLSYRKTQNHQFLILGFILAGLASLPVGLGAPMLEIGAFERNLSLGEIPISAKVMGFNVNVEVAQNFAGDMYFYYQSKSVLELIALLFRQQNWIVGLSILLFSVLFPLAKITSTLWLVLKPNTRRYAYLVFWVEKSGKWSMADVFVVAVFLAFLAFNSMQIGINTDSRILVGLYFFLAYCLLSLLSSIWVKDLKKDQLTETIS